MTTPQLRPRRNVADIVATSVLGALGAGAGVVLGLIFLAFTPMVAWWPVWSILAIVMMVAPLVFAVVGVVRIRRGGLGFWLPLVGFGVLLVIVVVLALLSTTIQPVLQPV